MAKRTEKITVDGVEYVIHALNLDDLERFSEIMESQKSQIKQGIEIMKLALARAEPKITNLGELEPTLDEINNAVDKITKLAGLQKSTANPPVAAAA